MRSLLSLGFLAALCHPSYATFQASIVNQLGLPLLHDVQDATPVVFNSSPSPDKNVWTFNTEGRNDDEAVITPQGASKTLVCRPGSPCSLDPNGAKQVYHIMKADDTLPIFVIRDVQTSFYFNRAADGTLALSPLLQASCYFRLQVIEGTIGQ